MIIATCQLRTHDVPALKLNKNSPKCACENIQFAGTLVTGLIQYLLVDPPISDDVDKLLMVLI